MRLSIRLSVSLALAVLSIPLSAQGKPDRTGAILTALDARAAHYSEVAKQIWGFAEVGYQEVKSSALLQAELSAAGFRLKSGIAGEPTAFTAEVGSGKPVIAIIGEFDALPGLSQDTTPEAHPITAGAPGHGCGHHLFGTAAIASAIAVKEWMIANKIPGTLRFYGTPAEEGGSGKVFMVRDGLFDDVDAAVTWHPGDRNDVNSQTSQGTMTAKFRFHGVSSHAAASPQNGRSALDAVEIMDVMTNFLREHIPEDTRIHYVITNGGKAPNVVPDFAEVYYYVRNKDMRIVDDVWERVVNAAKGAALGTGTTFDMQIVGSVHPLLINQTLAKVQQRALERVGGYTYTPAEKAWAEKLQRSLPAPAVPLETTAQVAALDFTPRSGFGGSTDVGDVSWRVPTVQMSAATWVPGTSAHSWQAVAAGGTTIGAKGMMVAAKTIALTAADLFSSPATVAAARAEFDKQRGPDFKYVSRVGTMAPVLDYRR
jgi:aminobenzoyl-glutamate utilization protein B